MKLRGLELTHSPSMLEEQNVGQAQVRIVVPAGEIMCVKLLKEFFSGGQVSFCSGKPGFQLGG